MLSRRCDAKCHHTHLNFAPDFHPVNTPQPPVVATAEGSKSCNPCLLTDKWEPSKKGERVSLPPVVYSIRTYRGVMEIRNTLKIVLGRFLFNERIRLNALAGNYLAAYPASKDNQVPWARLHFG